jgi:hypothetical protein
MSIKVNFLFGSIPLSKFGNDCFIRIIPLLFNLLFKFKNMINNDESNSNLDDYKFNPDDFDMDRLLKFKPLPPGEQKIQWKEIPKYMSGSILRTFAAQFKVNEETLSHYCESANPSIIIDLGNNRARIADESLIAIVNWVFNQN